MTNSNTNPDVYYLRFGSAIPIGYPNAGLILWLFLAGIALGFLKETTLTSTLLLLNSKG
jgi:hypothetical protein